MFLHHPGSCRSSRVATSHATVLFICFQNISDGFGLFATRREIRVIAFRDTQSETLTMIAESEVVPRAEPPALQAGRYLVVTDHE